MVASFQFGFPLDSNNLQTSRSGYCGITIIFLSHLLTRVDWTMFIAAAASDIALRDGLISRLHAYASPNLENQPFEVVYNPMSGHQITGAARSVTLYMYIESDCVDEHTCSPAQGAMFALLADQ